MLLPCAANDTLLTDGCYSIQEFYDSFIQPGVADANTQAMWNPVLTRFRVAVTEATANGNPPVIGVTPTTMTVPGEQAGLRSFVRSMKSELKVKAGLAPGVTPSLTFNSSPAWLTCAPQFKERATRAWRWTRQVLTRR